MMTEKERELTRDMLDLIDRIKNKTDYINTDDRIPELELEVLLSKIEQLHQKAIGLKYLHQHADEISTLLYSRLNDNQEITEPETTEVVAEDQFEETNVKQFEEPAADENEVEIAVEHIKKDISSLGVGNFSSSSEDIGKRLQQQPISDIKSAIGINDKFLYINELFGGSSEEFEAMVSLLNQFTSLEEARQSLEKYGWEKENETTQSFLTLVTRRYL
ncbi:MAG: hypothetical protein JKY42_02415 [Flavobacteriales bacterium]|nr:hypothetical protein [Flavobacteriales bacterium]